ncbi:hypothetical protein VE03_10687, partial [Pseudogymnoascus sp. 23342-1-I1]
MPLKIPGAYPERNVSIKTPRDPAIAREKKILEELVNVLEIKKLVGAQGIVDILRNGNKARIA